MNYELTALNTSKKKLYDKNTEAITTAPDAQLPFLPANGHMSQ